MKLIFKKVKPKTNEVLFASRKVEYAVRHTKENTVPCTDHVPAEIFELTEVDKNTLMLDLCNTLYVACFESKYRLEIPPPQRYGRYPAHVHYLPTSVI